MKSLALILASLTLAPALFTLSRGAWREHWPTVTLAAAVLAGLVGSVYYLT